MKKRLLMMATLALFGGSLSADIFYDNCCVEGLGCCDQCYEFGLWFDPMAVNPCQMPLEYAESSQGVVLAGDEVNLTSLDSQDHFISPDWCFGFRTGAGIRSQCSGWSLRADYVYWRTDTSSSTSVTAPTIVGGTGTLQPTIAKALDQPQMSLSMGGTGAVDTRLKYDYDMLDVTAGWSCCVCNGLEMTPYGGFRGLWFRTDVKQVNSQVQDAATIYSAEGDPSTLKNDYSAYGIVGGLRFNYNICGCFNFYGWFGGSIVSGDNDVEITYEANGSNFVALSEKETICLFNHSLEGAWGLTYDFCLCGFGGHLGVGYEVVQWNDVMPQPFRENSTTEGMAQNVSKGLFTQSITGRIGFAF